MTIVKTKLKVELDSSYATNSELKNTGDVDTSELTEVVDLDSLKSIVDKLDIDKLVELNVDK